MPVLPDEAIRAAGAYMIMPTERREITPYVWVHPDEER
jgi:hypothetical protein